MRIAVWDIIFFCFLPLFLMQPTSENLLIVKLAVRENIWTHKKKFWAQKIPMWKNFVPTKYPREKRLYPRNTHKKSFRPTKFPQKRVWIHKAPARKKIRTHEIPMIKTFVSTKYRRRHNGTRPMRLTMAHNARNLAHPIKRYFEKFCQLLSIFVQESLFNKFVGLQSAASFKKNYLADVFSK